MKKYTILLAAALLAALSGCGDKTPEETAAPTPSPTVAASTAQPTQTPQPSATPTQTAEPTAQPSAAPTPEATAQPSAAPTPEATAPATETPAPEQSTPPEPTESLCHLPLAPTPTPEVTDPPEAAPSAEPPLADEAIRRAYYEAEEAYSWFAGYGEAGLELDLNDPLTSADITRYRVTRPGLNTLDSLRAYLKTLFSDEIVDALVPVVAEEERLAHPEKYTFAEAEGGLYARPAGRGKDITKGTMALDISWAEGEDPILCTVGVTVQLMQWDDQGGSPTVVGEQRYEFPYQKVGDKWVFTRFESIF